MINFKISCKYGSDNKVSVGEQILLAEREYIMRL